MHDVYTSYGNSWAPNLKLCNVAELAIGTYPDTNGVQDFGGVTNAGQGRENARKSSDSWYKPPRKKRRGRWGRGGIGRGRVKGQHRRA